MGKIIALKKLLVFTGAGVSAESGIKTFRDSDGLWEEYDIMDVATPEAWLRQPKVVLEFYNARRKQVLKAEPNPAHLAIVDLEKRFDVQVVTQNIDDLHERAGSKKVLHLHGEIRKAKSTLNPELLYELQKESIEWGDKCELGSQLRPHVVWFGEEVPMMLPAQEMVGKADVMIVVGTSLNVYPAAALVYHTRTSCPIYVIDPGDPLIPRGLDVTWLKENATSGMKRLLGMI
ncbi:MAG: NAD-dependent deacylase [Vicingaceae bacterium]